MIARFAAALAIVLAGLGVIAGGCGDNGTQDTAAPEGGSTMTTALPALPPIDLLAPASFETASFALG